MMNFKKTLALTGLCFLVIPACQAQDASATQTSTSQAASLRQVSSMADSLLPWETPRDTTCHQVLLETTMGNIRVALYNDTPLHRDNFLKLVREGYYNGCTFQRVIKNFMIQGGDYSCRKVTPGKEEKFDVNYTIPAEIRYPEYYHKRGQLCMAREGDDENPTKASAPTDFYITWGRNFSPRQMEYYVEKMQREGKNYAIPSAQIQEGYIKHGGVPHLDNGYTVFGEVLEGMDVVEKIQNVATDKGNNDRPLQDIIITKATIIK